jgi:dihydroorotate dehydrogenase (fumarate)
MTPLRPTPDLGTTWLGLPLRSPLVVGAALPLSEHLELLQTLQEHGAAAVVLHSLFEEQITQEQLALHWHACQGEESTGEALSYLPRGAGVHEGPDGYLRLIEQARHQLAIPVIASLNGSHPGRWVEMARRIEAAGASALELNIYVLPTDPDLSSIAIELQVEEIVRTVRAEVRLPLAVKLGPFFTNLRAMARRLAAAGADGLVLFNRFYQPDIDIEELELRPNLLLSTPHDLRLPLRWIALLHGREPLDLAASGGVHRGTDVVRLLMAGASATQLVAALLRHGPERLRGIEDELSTWLMEHDYGSLQELRGCMSQQRCADPGEYERAQYLRAVRGPWPGLLP